MPDISPHDIITQQLNALSLDELLEIRAEVDALIEKKASPFNRDQQPPLRILSVTRHLGSYRGTTPVSSEMVDKGILRLTTIPPSTLIGSFHLSNAPVITSLAAAELQHHNDLYEYQAFEVSEQKLDNKDNSLEKVIGLVNEWMADESGYDEREYPEIEAGLKQNRLSL